MCFFIIPIPIGLYDPTAAPVLNHSRSSFYRWSHIAYVGCHDATFGPKGGRIRRWVMALMWFIVFATIGAFTAFMGVYWKAAPF